MKATSPRRIAWYAWLAMGFGLSLMPSAFAQGLPPKVIVWNNPTSSTVPGQFAILGEVERPGVYSSDAVVTLQQLVTEAGGFRPHASPAVRIIRSGRSGQTLFFNPNGRDNLQSGDYVVVDRNLQPGAAMAADSRVWIGLSGVSRQPVVVPLAPEDAQLAVLMRALGQSEQLAKSAGVILPPGVSSITLNSPLPNGTVIVLNPNYLVWSELPVFPEAHPIPQMASAPPVPQFATIAEPEPTVPAIPLPPVPTPPGLTNTAPVNTPFDRELTASTLPFTTTPAIETPANPTSLPAPGSRLAPSNLAPPPPPLEPGYQVSTNLTDALRERIASGDSDIVGEMTTPARQSSPMNLWQMLGIAGTVVSLIGVALGTRQYLGRSASEHLDEARPAHSSRISAEMFSEAAERAAEARLQRLEQDIMTARELATRPATVTEPVEHIAPIVRESLADLLQRRTPIVAEAVTFPSGMQLVARERSKETQFRIDATHDMAIPAPHLPRDAFPAPEIEFEVDLASVTKVPRPHFAIKATPPAPVSEASIETRGSATSAAVPAIAPKQEIAQSEPPRDIPLDEDRFQTPIERALARLQRGRPS